jgi:hypothetical protein
MKTKAYACFMIVLLFSAMHFVQAGEAAPAFGQQSRGSQTPDLGNQTPKILAENLKYWKGCVKALETALREPGYLFISYDGSEYFVKTDIRTIKEGIMIGIAVKAWRAAHDQEEFVQNFILDEVGVARDIIETTDKIYDRLIKEDEEIRKNQWKELERLKDFVRQLEVNIAELTGNSGGGEVDSEALERDKKTMLGELDVIRQRDGWNPDDHVLVAGEINRSRTPEALRLAGTLIIDFSKCYQASKAERDRINQTAKANGWMPGQRIAALDKAAMELRQCKNDAFDRHTEALRRISAAAGAGTSEFKPDTQGDLEASKKAMGEKLDRIRQEEFWNPTQHKQAGDAIGSSRTFEQLGWAETLMGDYSACYNTVNAELARIDAANKAGRYPNPGVRIGEEDKAKAARNDCLAAAWARYIAKFKR